MKLKYYLRGVGIGLFAATLILMIAGHIHPISDNEVMSRARELGMVMPEEVQQEDKTTLADLKQDDQTNEDSAQKEEAQTGADEQKKDQTDQKQNKADQTKNDSDETKQNTDAKQTDQTAETDKKTQDKKEDTAKTDVIEKVVVAIIPGDYSDKVAKKLEKAGLIDDAEDFNKYLADKNCDNLIQPGNYEIPKNSDYDEIVKIITEKKKKS